MEEPAGPWPSDMKTQDMMLRKGLRPPDEPKTHQASPQEDLRWPQYCPTAPPKHAKRANDCLMLAPSVPSYEVVAALR